MKFRILIITVVLSLFLAGCSSLSATEVQSTHTITSEHNEVQIDTPTNWTKSNGPPLANLLTLYNTQREKGITVERMERSILEDGTTVQQYMDSNTRGGAWKISDTTKSDEKNPLIIDSASAYIDQGEIKAGNFPSTYFLRVSFEKEYHFYSITIMSHSKINSMDWELLTMVAPTLKVLDDTPKHLKLKTVTTNNGNAEIQIPLLWGVDPTILAGTVLSARDKYDTQSLHIMHMLKSDFEGDSPPTLEWLAEAYVELFQEEYVNVTQSETRHVVVDGQEGLQFELKAMISGERFRHLITIFDYSDHVVIIQFSSLSDLFEDNKEKYEQYVESYHEQIKQN
ncbi:TPA: hypothetical protein ACG3KH_004257 [Clostridioides difficile]